jgi:predicted glycoside hydrolase/deacetylase ChbG (UPF0249 family)
MPPERPGRRLAVCADDFGFGPAVSRGIADLAARGRINAVSCLSGGADWQAAAVHLAALPRTVERGLHFNLTEGRPLSADLRRVWPELPTLPRLLISAGLRRLPLAAIGVEWKAQWDAFADRVGAAPDFVDGHQHVHHLPGVREQILDALVRRHADVAVRNTGRLPGTGSAFKRWVIEYTGGRSLDAALRARGLRHNAALLGVYGFDAVDYRQRMRGWLRHVPATGALLFCHPAAAGQDPGDPIASARRREADYLGSDAFVQDLDESGVSLGPVWQQTPSGD